MKRSLLILFLLVACMVQAQQISLSGYVRDKKTGEALVGASIYAPEIKKGVIANQYGYFHISLPAEKKVVVRVSFIGYTPESYTIEKGESNTCKRNFYLASGVELNEVRIEAERIERHRSEVLKLTKKQIKQLPALMGETDVMKAFQLLPGVQQGSEGSSQLHVRGGSPDQNLILMDGVPLYYVNHAGGWFSVFDENAINDVRLIKGGFPARYGGRLSSVVDVAMKEGSLREYKGILSLGIINSKLSFEGPIKKDTASFFISARRCNLDMFSRAIMSFSTMPMRAGYTFYDINAKTNYKLSDKDHFFLSFYMGDDVLFFETNGGDRSEDLGIDYERKFNNKWGNVLGSFRYNRTFSPRLFANFTLSYMRYRYMTKDESERENKNLSSHEIFESEGKSSINDVTFKYDFDFFHGAGSHLRFGGSSVHHLYNPKSEYSLSQFNGETTMNSFRQKEISTFEHAIYIDEQWKPLDAFEANLGIRFSLNQTDGTNYHAFEPRANVLYHPFRSTTISASYTQMKQYVHLLSNASVGLAYDMWFPSTRQIRPQDAQQFTLGVGQNLLQNRIFISVEGYYKNMRGLIDFKEGYSFSEMGMDWQQAVETGGKGEAYGIEFLVKKEQGSLTGWLSYTYAKNNRQFAGLNEGKTFPYRYDRRHSASVVINCKLSEKWKVSANWVFTTGEAMTLGVGKFNVPAEVFDYEKGFILQQETAYQYGARNNFRLPSYHRLDVSFTYRKKKEHGTIEWVLGAYNLYNQKNAYMFYFDQDKSGELKLHQLIAFPLLPSISYRYYIDY